MFNNYKFKPYQLYFRHTANYYVISAAKIIKNANKCKKNNVVKTRSCCHFAILLPYRNLLCINNFCKVAAIAANNKKHR